MAGWMCLTVESKALAVVSSTGPLYRPVLRGSKRARHMHAAINRAEATEASMGGDSASHGGCPVVEAIRRFRKGARPFMAKTANYRVKLPGLARWSTCQKEFCHQGHYCGHDHRRGQAGPQ